MITKLYISIQIIASDIDVSLLPNPNGGSGNDDIRKILSIVYGIVGGLALLYIVISGARYIFSDGDPQKAAQAKQGILYSLIGLTVALLAQALTYFVIGRIT